MRRLFVPSVVLLVMAVVVMVGSWCGVFVVLPRGQFTVFVGMGNIDVFVIREGRVKDEGVSAWGYRGFAFPLLPSFDAEYKATTSTAAANSLTWLFGTRVTVPTWYFVALFGALAAIFWRPWLTACRLRAGECAACGYDMTGGGAVCPECGASGGAPASANQTQAQ